MNLLCLLFLSVWLIWPGNLWAGPTPQEVMTRVQAQYDRTSGFKAHFRQTSRLRAVNQEDTAEGWLYFQKPCRMRWQYETPPEQQKEIITDGREVWLYNPQDNVAMVYPLNQVLRSDLVMRFFSGMGKFRQDFEISWRRPPDQSLHFIIDLYPKVSRPEVKRLTLTINPQTYLVENLEFSNALGEETRFTFSRLSMDARHPAGFFTFTPPPGVRVVRERAQGNKVTR